MIEETYTSKCEICGEGFYCEQTLILDDKQDKLIHAKCKEDE